MRISCPPTIGPCHYGVDTPTREELIASSRSVEEIAEFIGADSLGYLSLDGLLGAVADEDGEEFCTACYTRVYPVPIGETRPQLRLFSGYAGESTGEDQDPESEDTPEGGGAGAATG